MSSRIPFFILGFFFAVLAPHAVFAASLYMDPATSTYGPGDTFIETVRIDNQDDCLNAINVEVSYPKDALLAADFSRGESILSLWAVEPHIDRDAGVVTFAGGIPGGYCGRIAGDASQSNILGKIIFTVVQAKAPSATIQFTQRSKAYLNDGQGTATTLALRTAEVALSPVPVLKDNPWLAQVKEDTTPPQPFSVDVQSTVGVYGGRYYIVFATTDKESGIDHFEISEHGGWKYITSPYLLRDQSLLGVGEIQVRAVDKAGNTRLGTYTASATPPRHFTYGDFVPFLVFVVVVLLIGIKMQIDQRKKSSGTPAA